MYYIIESIILFKMKCVILAGGFGKRVLPASLAMPKEMFVVDGKPAIQHVVEEASQAGLRDILIVTGKSKRTIEDHFDFNTDLEISLRSKGDFETLDKIRAISDLADIEYVRQKEPLGIGNAVLMAKRHIASEPMVLMLGDDVVRSKTPCVKQLLGQYEKTYSTTLAIESVPMEEAKRYGVIKGELCDDGLYEVRDLIEKPQTFISSFPGVLAMVGRYILTPEIFNAIEKTKPGYNNEIQLTDALKLLLSEQPIYAYKFEGKRHDVGSFGGLLKANLDYAKDNPEYRDLLNEFCYDWMNNTEPVLKNNGK